MNGRGMVRTVSVTGSLAGTAGTVGPRDAGLETEREAGREGGFDGNVKENSVRSVRSGRSGTGIISATGILGSGRAGQLPLASSPTSLLRALCKTASIVEGDGSHCCSGGVDKAVGGMLKGSFTGSADGWLTCRSWTGGTGSVITLGAVLDRFNEGAAAFLGLALGFGTGAGLARGAAFFGTGPRGGGLNMLFVGNNSGGPGWTS